MKSIDVGGRAQILCSKEHLLKRDFLSRYLNDEKKTILGGGGSKDTKEATRARREQDVFRNQKGHCGVKSWEFKRKSGKFCFMFLK